MFKFRSRAKRPDPDRCINRHTARTARRGRASGHEFPRHLCRQRRHPIFSKSGRLEHPCACRSIVSFLSSPAIAAGDDRFDGRARSLLDRLVAVGPRCRPACHHQSARRAGRPGPASITMTAPGFALTFYVPRYRQLTVALWQQSSRRALWRSDRRARLRSPEQTDLALYRRRTTSIRCWSRFIAISSAAIRRVDPQPCCAACRRAMEARILPCSNRPFDANAVYTYHKFWANPTRAALQSYVNFSRCAGMCRVLFGRNQ